jgi:hypothetical protein
MNKEDIIRMAREAGANYYGTGEEGVTAFMLRDEAIERFAALVAAAEREHIISDGWRQCAQGQRTSQFCAVAEQARREEREACAKLIESRKTGANELMDAVRDTETRAIRARGQA